MEILIYRGATLIADGSSASVNGRPLADCEHAMEIFPLINADAPDVVDYGVKQNTVTLTVWRQFSTDMRALDHALRGAQSGTGKHDLVIFVDDGTDEHTWTLSDRGGTGAAWQQARCDRSSGVGTDTTYQITGGEWSYDGPLPASYGDGISGSPLTLDGGAVIPRWLTSGGEPGTTFASLTSGGTP